MSRCDKCGLTGEMLGRYGHQWPCSDGVTGGAPIAAAPAAIDATLQDRGKTYGNFLTQSGIALKIKKAMDTSPNWPSLESDQREALDMIAVKIARILNGNANFHDSWHDISGYAKLVADRLTP